MNIHASRHRYQLSSCNCRLFIILELKANYAKVISEIFFVTDRGDTVYRVSS